jgi:hypothetical protein
VKSISCGDVGFIRTVHEIEMAIKKGAADEDGEQDERCPDFGGVHGE